MNISYPDDADGDVLSAMAESGVDMTQPLTIEFVIDAPGEQNAMDIEKDLIAAGHPAVADFEDGDPEEGIDPGWVVSVELQMVPDYQRIMDLQEELNRFAGAHGGQVDGWGAMVD
jgi:hypothetical protein